jgi:hypothetical protein
MVKGNFFMAFLIMVAMVIVCSGMADATQWAKSYGWAGNDVASSIEQTSDGGYIVAGATASFDESESYLWVLKLDSSGNVQWQKTYGGTDLDFATSIKQTSDGGYIVAGVAYSFGVGNGDLWVLKLDPSGNVKWQKTYGKAGGDVATSIEQTSDGGYIVAGATDSFGKGFSDLWVLKLDSSGNVQWQKTYGGADWDEASSIEQTSDGGYIVAGETDSFGAGRDDLWILKLDSSRNVQWQKTYGGAKDDMAKSIWQTSDGGYIVAGMTESFGDIKGDLWVLKLDSSGNVQWQKTYGGAKDDGAISVKQTSDGGYIVAGGTDSFGKGNEDLWVLKLDSSGNVQWQRTYGGVGFDDSSSIQQTSDGGYIVAGATNSFGAGDDDSWVLKLDANGEIKDCPAMGTSNATVNNTNATVADTNASISDTNATVADTNATITNTNATVTVVCSYIPLFPDISVAPTSHNFGNVNVGSPSAPQTFTISNTGTANLVISTLSITGTDASQFSKQNDNCSGQTLAPATNCTVQVVFSPASAGSKSANLSIPSNDPDTPALNVPLSDTGVAPPCEGDFDSDKDVDGSDLAVFAADFGRTDCGSGQPCEGDFDNDGDVDGSDLAVFAADFGRTDCPH